MYRNSGSCRHGDKCKYEHSEGEPISAGPAEECFTFRDEGSCSRGDDCRFTHGANDPRFVDGLRDISGEECRNWTRGSCRLGDGCPRLHVGEEGASKGRGGGGGGGGRAPRAKKERGPRTPGVCFDFQRGSCDRGDECRFSHDAELLAAAGELLFFAAEDAAAAGPAAGCCWLLLLVVRQLAQLPGLTLLLAAGAQIHPLFLPSLRRPAAGAGRPPWREARRDLQQLPGGQVPLRRPVPPHSLNHRVLGSKSAFIVRKLQAEYAQKFIISRGEEYTKENKP